MFDHLDWGVREYGEALAEMRALRAARRRGEIEDTLILVEHPPVITVGVQGAEGDLTSSGLPIFQVERGGKSTYHGPGQVVGYPIVDLTPRGRDVRRFVHDVEQLVVAGIEEFGLHGARIPGRRGVWLGGERKIASVGIAVEEWVTFHGFALNVDPDLAAFRQFRPCGFDGSVMTSMAEELGHPLAVGSVKHSLVRAWTEIFGSSSRSEAPSGAAPPGATPASP